MIKDVITPSVGPISQNHFSIHHEPTKKLDQLLLPGSLRETKDGSMTRSTGYVTIDLMKKNQIIHEVIRTSEKAWQSCSLNWNNEELGTIYFLKDEGSDFNRDNVLFFDMTRSNILEKGCIKSLKHLARLAVLTSLSYNQLLESNLPSSLVNYLGIEK